MEVLAKCTKDQLFKLADDYSVVVGDKRKDSLKTALEIKLGEFGVLPTEPGGVYFSSQGLTFEQQKELLLLQTEQGGSSTQHFDINNLRLLPHFNERDPDSFFILFERVSRATGWSDKDCVLLLQCVLMGKAQEAYSSLSFKDSFS